MGRHLDAGGEFAVTDHRGEGITSSDHIPHLDRDITNHTGDRRAQVAEGEICFAGSQAGGGGDVGLAQLITLQGTGSPYPRQVIEALVVEPVLGLGRAQAGYLRLQLFLIEHHKQLTRFHLHSLSNAQIQDPSTCLGSKLHRFHRIEGADRHHLFTEGGGAHINRVNGQRLASLWVGRTATRQQCQTAEGDCRKVAPKRHEWATNRTSYKAQSHLVATGANFYLLVLQIQPHTGPGRPRERSTRLQSRSLDA